MKALRVWGRAGRSCEAALWVSSFALSLLGCSDRWTRCEAERSCAPAVRDDAGNGDASSERVSPPDAADDVLGDAQADVTLDVTLDATSRSDGSDGGNTNPTGVATASSPCAPEGGRACAGHASTEPLRCTGVWVKEAACASSERCDTAPGPTRGTCRSIVPECETATAGVPFCVGDVVRTCIDLVSFEDAPCGSNATCDPGAAQCVCKAGYGGPADDCRDTDECQATPGVCDTLVKCTNSDGGYSCNPCPSGYVGDGSLCTPALTDLTVSTGKLVPAFDPAVTDYTVVVPLATETLLVTPTTIDGTTITVNGQNVASGTAWSSGALLLGDNGVGVAVGRPARGGLSYSITVTRGRQEAYLKASEPTQGIHFGQSVAVSGDTVVVGAPVGSGAAYVFVRSGPSWERQAVLSPRATGVDQFGASVAIDGDTIAIGAPGDSRDGTGGTTASGSGAVYVFTRTGTAWTEQALLKANNLDPQDAFGSSVAISGDTIAAGAPDEDSNATGVNGDGANDSLGSAGAAYVFVRTGTAWSQQAYVKPGTAHTDDQFGHAVGVSGNALVVGAPRETGTGLLSGAAYVLVRSGGTWSPGTRLLATNADPADQFGTSVAVSGGTVIVGAFLEDGSASGVDGPLADNGANGSGAAYVFVQNGATWTQQAYLKASNTDAGDLFGTSVAISGDLVVVGAPNEAGGGSGLTADEKDDSKASAGAAYLFLRTGAKWAHLAYLKASNTDAGDLFGSAVAVDADTVVVGAESEDGNATTVNGDQTDNSASATGAAYLLR